MKRRIVLLLSLLCVAQALPLVYGDGHVSDLTRNKRSKDGHSTLADREVRTIISAIVDAILDGDKKKRSNIQEDEDEIEGNEQNNTVAPGKIQTRNLNSTATDDNENENSSSGSGNNEQDESGSTSTTTSDASGDSNNDISSGSGESSSGSGSNNVDIEENKSVETSELVQQESPPFSVNPTFSNTERIKRDEEGQDNYRPTVNILKRDIEDPVLVRPTESSRAQYKSNVVDAVETADDSDGSGSGENVSESSTTTSGSGSADDISTTTNNNELNKRDAIPNEENDENSSNNLPLINKKTDTIAVVYKNESQYIRNMTSVGLVNATSNEEDEAEGTSSADEDNASTDGDAQSSVSSDEASASIDEKATSTAIEVETSGEDIDGSGSGIEPILTLTNVTNHLNNIDTKPKTMKPQSNNTTNNIKTVSQKINKTENEEENKKEEGSIENDSAEEEVESSGEEGSGETVTKKSKIIEQIVLDMARAAVESVESGKHTGTNEEDENGETKGSVVKKSSVPFEVISSEDNLRNNMNPALIIITGDSDSDSDDSSTEEIDRRSTIPKESTDGESKVKGKNKISDDDDLITVQEISPYKQQDKAQKTTSKIKDIYKRSAVQTKHTDDTKRTTMPVYQSTVEKNELPSLQDKQYTKDNEALQSLVKSILNNDPSIKSRIKEITNGKIEKEEKLENDLIDLINKNSKKSSTEDDDGDETKEKVVTEVKDFERLVQALTQENTLSSWKHDVIVKKLEKDLLNHLSIPEDDEKMMGEQADELTEYSEMDFIKDKVLEAEADTSSYAQQHSHNLKAIRKHAVSALRPIIESLPLKKTDVDDLVHSISKSAWLKMVSHAKKSKHTSKKLRRSLKELSQNFY